LITPRRTTLLRARDLRAFQRAIAGCVDETDPFRARDCAVIVPTRAAGEQLRRTLERLRLEVAAESPVARVSQTRALILPDIVTREDWYARLHQRLPGAPPLLSEFEREVVARACARAVRDAGTTPPFRLRPALIAEMLAFYDELKRREQTLDDFERLVGGRLEESAEADHGAARMLQQTRFLAAFYREYESRVGSSGQLDEHALRLLARSSPSPRPFRRIVVTVADQAADPRGLWPADFDLLARLPGLDELEIVATESVLASGFHQRIHDLLPGIDEVGAPADGAVPIVVAPDDPDRLFWIARDREEELVEIARYVKRLVRLKPDTTSIPLGSVRLQPDSIRTQPHRFAVVFQRPLPYLYLAKHVFGAARLPWQASDALPLAAEPFSAALDVVLSFVWAGFTRSGTIELLRSPHLGIGEDASLSVRDIAALERALVEAKFVGGREGLEQLAARLSGGAGRAARAAADAAAELDPVTTASSASVQIEALVAFVQRHQGAVAGDRAWRERHARARAAILGALTSLAGAHRRYDETPLEAGELVGTIRRWIESQTFSPRAGGGGLHLVDAHAARYGDFDEARIVGMVDGDWPARPGRSIFYPAFLLNQLGWPAEADRLAGARAAFRDLLRVPSGRVSASAFTLEEDAVIAPSTFVEELEATDLVIHRAEPARPCRIFVHEALADDPLLSTMVEGSAAEWLALRLSRTAGADPRFRGMTGARTFAPYAVSAVEQYLSCPFKFFAASILRLEEEKGDEPGLTRIERGQFVHEVLCEFFTEWQRAGRGAITPENLDVAVAEFTRAAEARLATLSEADRALERTHLLGSAAAAGLAERAFGFELERPVAVIERLLEHRLEGAFTFRGGESERRVRIRGKADRVDLLADGSLRVIDYKLGKAPKAAKALQLPVYGRAAVQALAGAHGRTWTLGDAGYVAFGERQPFVPLGGRQGELDPAVAAGEARFLDAIDAIERGEFVVRPEEPYLCRFCPYPSVCRKDYVGDE
jgi:RecB family exonuclease